VTAQNPTYRETDLKIISCSPADQKIHQDESLKNITDSPVSDVAAQPMSPQQKVPSAEFDLAKHSEFFNTPSMKFLDDFFEETLFG
jgi:hypothetical protein